MNPYKPKHLPLDCIDWESHVTLIGQANAALARFDGAMQTIINPHVLLSPLTTQEAVLSSRIEGTQASMEDVLEYQAEPKKPIDQNKQTEIQEIINYQKAMNSAVEDMKARPFCLNLMKQLHAILLNSVRGRNKSPGEFRRVQNFIGAAGDSIDKATFVPPSVNIMKPAMENWEIYYQSSEKDSLVQLAVLKAQFELIHPFLDGNGRIGRMIVPLFLFDKKLLSQPMFYISSYLESNRDVYYAKLNAISQQDDWNGWIRFFLNAIVVQANENTVKTKNIVDLYNQTKQVITDTTHSQFSIQALDALFLCPIFSGTDFKDITRIENRTTASKLVKQLLDSDIIRVIEEGSGRRPSKYVFPELLRLIAP